MLAVSKRKRDLRNEVELRQSRGKSRPFSPNHQIRSRLWGIWGAPQVEARNTGEQAPYIARNGSRGIIEVLAMSGTIAAMCKQDRGQALPVTEINCISTASEVAPNHKVVPKNPKGMQDIVIPPGKPQE